MKLADLNPLILLTIGAATGALAAALFFPKIIPLPDGWTSVAGSTFGVLGAFLVANWNFKRTIEHRDQERNLPFDKRIDFCIERINQVSDKFVKLRHNIINLYSTLGFSYPEDDKWQADIQSFIYGEKFEFNSLITIINMAKDFNLEMLDCVDKKLSEIFDELEWLKNKIKDDFSPNQLNKFDEILETITTFRKISTEAKISINNISNIRIFNKATNLSYRIIQSSKKENIMRALCNFSDFDLDKMKKSVLELEEVRKMHRHFHISSLTN